MTASLSDALVFFGATGDLAYKQIFPALQAMIKRSHLDLPIIGVARSGKSLDEFRNRARDSLEKHGGLDAVAFARLAARLQYIAGDYRDSATYEQLCRALGNAARPLHYLAIPPSMFEPVTQGLARSACARNGRGIVEKPFGRSLASAQALNRTLHACFPEEAIFRIDHYLGKEAVTVDAAWRVVDPILGDAVPAFEYEPDTWGPPAAGRILGGDDRWHNPASEEVLP